VVQHLRQLLVSANETTVNLIADTLRVVLTHDRFRAQLAGGSMTLPDALDDVLWNNPPLRVLPARYAIGDTTLGGHQIRKGDMVLNGLAAGNEDPSIRPDLTVSMQGNRSHLSFSGGPHECPGQNIGRAIAESSIDVLLGRLPDLHIAVTEDELTRSPTWMSSHLDTLPVEFAPRRAEGQPVTAAPLPNAVPERAAVPDLPSQPPAFPAAPQPQRVSWWRRLLSRR
jgi:cytochrome P450